MDMIVAPKVPNSISRNLHFYYFGSFVIVWLRPFISNSDSLIDLIISMVSFISSLEIVSVVLPDPNIFRWRAASVVDAAAFNPNGLKTL